MACSPSRACFWTGMYAPQHGHLRHLRRRHAVHDGPVDPDDRRPVQGARLPDGVLRQVAPVVPRRAADQPRGRCSTLARATRSSGYGFDHSAISPPADVGGYNDGYTNDPIWTGQAVDWLKEHAHDEQPWLCVLSLLNPHDIQFYPRGFRADFKRPDYDAEPEPSFYAEPTLGDKPTGPGSASATSSRSIAGTPNGPRERPGVLARPAQHLLRPDRRHRRDARRRGQGGHRRRACSTTR